MRELNGTSLISLVTNNAKGRNARDLDEVSSGLARMSQNAKKATHVKGRLLDQAMILFNRVPFQNGTFSLRKEFAPRGRELLPLRAVSYCMETHFYYIR